MLNLAYDDEQQAVAEMTRDLGSEVLSPAAATTEQQKAVGDEAWQALHSTGLTALVSEDLGGDGIPSAVTQMIAIEQLAHGDPQATIAAVWSGAAAFFVSQHATPAAEAPPPQAGERKPPLSPTPTPGGQEPLAPDRPKTPDQPVTPPAAPPPPTGQPFGQ